MKLFGYELALRKQAPFESALLRLVMAQEGYGVYGPGLFASGMSPYVNAENCMMSPTVHAIVTAVSRRISVSPVQVFQMRPFSPGKEEAAEDDGSLTRVRKERLPNHPVEKLLNYPNDWQSRVNYWQDATSRLIRYGNYYAYKARGATGPIRQLIPIHPRQIQVEQDLTSFAVTYLVNGDPVPKGKLHHVRGGARNALIGDSPVMDVNAAIGLEIAAEQYGATFFNNGAMPLMIFKYMQGMQAFKSPEDEKQFVTDIQSAFSGNRRHRAMLLPKGLEVQDPIAIENDKAQMLETRKYQRTVIAGAFGVPPHLVGDLERATFNNVEQQGADFTVNVVLPIARCFEAAMERDLLTDQDVANNIIIRFDLNSVALADFKSRQEGLRVQRDAGIICPNDWREIEDMNPIPESDGGEDYIRPLNFVVAGQEPPAAVPGQPSPNAQPGASENGGGNGASAPKRAEAREILTAMLQGMTDLRERVEAVESRIRPAIVHQRCPSCGGGTHHEPDCEGQRA